MLLRHNGLRRSLWVPLAMTALAAAACSDEQPKTDIGTASSALTAWDNHAFSLSHFTATFDAVPSQDQADVVIGLSQNPGANFTDLAAIVRFNPAGNIDVRNGSDYAALTNVPYTAGTSYRFQMEVDVPSHTYTVNVTPAGGSKTLLAYQYAFRTEQASVTSLSYVSKGNPVGDATVSNTRISLPVASTSPTPTADAGSSNPTGAPVPDVTGFTTAANHATFSVDGREFFVSGPGQPHNLTNPDSQTLRFEIRSGEHWVYDSDAERSEIEGPTYPTETEVHVAYEFMMEPGGPNTAPWMVIGQLWSVGYSPPFAVELQGEKMRILVRWSADRSEHVAYLDPNPIERGRYYAMDVRVNYAKGTAVVLRDGVQILNYSGPLGYGGPMHWEYGVYRGPTTNDVQAARYRNLVISP